MQPLPPGEGGEARTRFESEAFWRGRAAEEPKPVGRAALSVPGWNPTPCFGIQSSKERGRPEEGRSLVGSVTKPNLIRRLKQRDPTCGSTRPGSKMCESSGYLRGFLR